MPENTPSVNILAVTSQYVCPSGHVFAAKDVKLIKFINRDPKSSQPKTENKENEEDKAAIMAAQNNIGYTRWAEMRPSGELISFRGGEAREGYLYACPVCSVVSLTGFQRAEAGSDTSNKACVPLEDRELTIRL